MLTPEGSKETHQGRPATARRPIRARPRRYIINRTHRKERFTTDAPDFFCSVVTHDLEAFKRECPIIVVNRWSDELADVAAMVYTRDLFKRD